MIELEEYVKWASENIASSDVEIIQPVLIGKELSDNAIERCKYYAINNRRPILVEYEVDQPNYFIKFIRKEY